VEDVRGMRRVSRFSVSVRFGSCERHTSVRRQTKRRARSKMFSLGLGWGLSFVSFVLIVLFSFSLSVVHAALVSDE
jgi:hypothetical protein